MQKQSVPPLNLITINTNIHQRSSALSAGRIDSRPLLYRHPRCALPREMRAEVSRKVEELKGESKQEVVVVVEVEET